MPKHVAVVLVTLVLAGASSSPLVSGALAQQTKLSAIQQAKRIGPKPTPHWYWRWQAWRLGEGYAKGHRLQPDLRPQQAPHPVPDWAWRRLHFVRLARAHPHAGAQSKTGNRKGGETYHEAISYTQTRPAFSPTRTINVSSASAFNSALSNLQAGDYVKATAPFTVTGQTIISNRLSGPAVLDLGTNVKFVYSAGSNVSAVWLKNPSNLRIYGGDLSTSDTGGNCITGFGAQNVLWWGFTAHDCGADGVLLSGRNLGPTENDDFQGTIWKVGQNLAWDPHTEKGSGEHCANLDDYNTYAFDNNRFAFYCHDIPTGAAIEYGASQAANPKPVNNTIILKAVNLTFQAQIQTGGNAIQFWGVDGQSANIKYLEVSNAQGYGLFDGGMYSGASLSGVTLEYGRASHTNLNPRYAGQGPWKSGHGAVYQRVQPAPRAG